MTRNKAQCQYVPAIKFRWLTFFYDLVTRWALGESTIKRRLGEQARAKISPCATLAAACNLNGLSKFLIVELEAMKWQ